MLHINFFTSGIWNYYCCYYGITVMLIIIMVFWTMFFSRLFSGNGEFVNITVQHITYRKRIFLSRQWCYLAWVLATIVVRHPLASSVGTQVHRDE